MALTDKLTNIADAIRGKTGGTDPLTLDGMATAIAGIEAGGGGGDYTNEQIIEMVSRTGTSFVIPNGCTELGQGAFYGWQVLKTLTIPNGVTKIGENAFAACVNLELAEIPDTVEYIGRNAFSSNGGCKALVRLPQSLKRIDQGAFIYSTKLKITEIPPLVHTIAKQAFQQCTELTSITFKGTPTSMTSDVFKSCTNLTVINVPWAEGTVANAPWGATSATINYNYTGG